MTEYEKLYKFGTSIEELVKKEFKDDYRVINNVNDNSNLNFFFKIANEGLFINIILPFIVLFLMIYFPQYKFIFVYFFIPLVIFLMIYFVVKNIGVVKPKPLFYEKLYIGKNSLIFYNLDGQFNFYVIYFKNVTNDLLIEKVKENKDTYYFLKFFFENKNYKIKSDLSFTDIKSILKKFGIPYKVALDNF